jgi:hypothetical protein
MLSGFSPPLTPGGRSSLVPPPPWHYAGWLFSIEVELDEQMAAAYLPPGLGRSTGRGAIHVADWQATTDGSELLDPAYAQYREVFVLVEAERDGSLVNFCPYIYVDQDISLLRGLLQGLPKKLGSVWMTRTYPLDHVAAAPLHAGTRLGASLAVKDRRLMNLELTLTGEAGDAIGFLRQPTFGFLGLPNLLGETTPADPQIVRMAADTLVRGASWAATASVEFLSSPRDELADLAPTRVIAASAGYAALSISSVVIP